MYSNLHFNSRFKVQSTLLTKRVRILANTASEAKAIKKAIKSNLAEDSDIKWLKPSTKAKVKEDTLYVYGNDYDYDKLSEDDCHLYTHSNLLTVYELIKHLIR